MNLILEKIHNQIADMKMNKHEPKFVILDIESWNILRADNNVREYILYGYEQNDPYKSDRIMGIPVALLTGYAGQTVEVV